MKTTAHTIISSATGLGLAAFTLGSFAIVGLAAPATVLGFSFLAVYGLCEMAFIDYTPLNVARARTAAGATARPNGKRVVVPAIVEFERRSPARRVAA